MSDNTPAAGDGTRLRRQIEAAIVMVVLAVIVGLGAMLMHDRTERIKADQLTNDVEMVASLLRMVPTENIKGELEGYVFTSEHTGVFPHPMTNPTGYIDEPGGPRIHEGNSVHIISYDNQDSFCVAGVNEEVGVISFDADHGLYAYDGCTSGDGGMMFPKF